MRHAVYDGRDEYGRDVARCACGGEAFGVAVHLKDQWFLIFSLRWGWNPHTEAFTHGGQYNSLPAPKRRGQAFLVPRTPGPKLKRGANYVPRPEKSFHQGVALPERFVCHGPCGAINVVERP